MNLPSSVFTNTHIQAHRGLSTIAEITSLALG
jgi:hypothetical protein